jgi:hypothetical protein
MALKQFSKILIFKNTPETRAAFGVNGNITPGTTDREFNSSWPTPTLSNFNNTFYENNLLHAMGVEENGMTGWNLEPESSGKAYIYNGYLNAFILNNYDGSVLNAVNLPAAASNNGNVYVVASENTPYTSNGTTWVAGSPIPFTFDDPSTPLQVGDMLLYGDDPNNLRIAGKITEIYDSGDPEWIDGKRYKFSRDNNPDNVNLNEYQSIYYYRGDWNGKNISVDITEGFYILIGVETSNSQRIIYPYLNTNATSGTSADQLIQPGTGNTAFTDLVRVKRISEKYKFDQDRLSENDETQEIIPCTIRRTNSIKTTEIEDPVTKQRTMVAFPNTGDFPFWVAYFVNPYGESASTLLKSSVYAIEINEMLPFFTINFTALNAVNYQLFLNQKV